MIAGSSSIEPYSMPPVEASRGTEGNSILPDGTRRSRSSTHARETSAIRWSTFLRVRYPGGIVGTEVTAIIEWERRYRLMRMHTCMHLLSVVIPADVTGGSIRDGSGRLDFDLPRPLQDKEHLTRELNRLVEQDLPVKTIWVTDEELAARPELVKTMSVKPPAGQGRVRLLAIGDVDLQACGGTHVARTGEIGRVVVTKTEKKGRHNRRVNVAFAPS